METDEFGFWLKGGEKLMPEESLEFLEWATTRRASMDPSLTGPVEVQERVLGMLEHWDCQAEEALECAGYPDGYAPPWADLPEKVRADKELKFAIFQVHRWLAHKPTDVFDAYYRDLHLVEECIRVGLAVVKSAVAPRATDARAGREFREKGAEGRPNAPRNGPRCGRTGRRGPRPYGRGIRTSASATWRRRSPAILAPRRGLPSTPFGSASTVPAEKVGKWR